MTADVDVQVLINITGLVELDAANSAELLAAELGPQSSLVPLGAPFSGQQEQVQADEPARTRRLVSRTIAIKRKKICTANPNYHKSPSYHQHEHKGWPEQPKQPQPSQASPQTQPARLDTGSPRGPLVGFPPTTPLNKPTAQLATQHAQSPMTQPESPSAPSAPESMPADPPQPPSVVPNWGAPGWPKALERPVPAPPTAPSNSNKPSADPISEWIKYNEKQMPNISSSSSSNSGGTWALFGLLMMLLMLVLVAALISLFVNNPASRSTNTNLRGLKLNPQSSIDKIAQWTRRLASRRHRRRTAAHRGPLDFGPALGTPKGAGSGSLFDFGLGLGLGQGQSGLSFNFGFNSDAMTSQALGSLRAPGGKHSPGSGVSTISGLSATLGPKHAQLNPQQQQMSYPHKPSTLHVPSNSHSSSPPAPYFHQQQQQQHQQQHPHLHQQQAHQGDLMGYQCPTPTHYMTATGSNPGYPLNQQHQPLYLNNNTTRLVWSQHAGARGANQPEGFYLPLSNGGATSDNSSSVYQTIY